MLQRPVEGRRVPPAHIEWLLLSDLYDWTFFRG
jgi:hypothetical protein